MDAASSADADLRTVRLVASMAAPDFTAAAVAASTVVLVDSMVEEASTAAAVDMAVVDTGNRC